MQNFIWITKLDYRNCFKLAINDVERRLQNRMPWVQVLLPLEIEYNDSSHSYFVDGLFYTISGKGSQSMKYNFTVLIE